MHSKRRFWFLAYPDLNKAVGGIKHIHRAAEIIDGLVSVAGSRECRLSPPLV